MATPSPDVSVGDLRRALLDLDEAEVRRLLDGGADGPTVEVLESKVVPALVGIGSDWEAGEVALSQVYLSGRLCQQVIDSYARPLAGPRPGQPVIAVGVYEDAHVLGKQIVVQMLASAGYGVIDLGVRLTAEETVAAVERHRVDVLVLSVLMLRAALGITVLRPLLAKRGRVPVIVVGGAPFRFDPALAQEVGADYGGSSAADILPIMARIEAGRR